MLNAKVLSGPEHLYKPNEDEYKTSIVKIVLCQIILVLLCLASYQHALDGSFVFDDTVAILKNSDVTTIPTNWTALFLNDFWGVRLKSVDSHKSFRPLTTLLFHLEYARLGLRAKHMKLINLILHCINTLLMWWLLRGFQFNDSNNVQISTIAAALFAIHPVHTEAVCGIVGRAELLFCSTYLIALLFTNLRVQFGAIADVVILTLTVVGILFKESAITIPLACIFLDYTRAQTYLHPWRTQIRMFSTLRNFIYMASSLTFLVLRLWLQDFQSPRFKAMDNPVAFNPDILTRILSQHFLYVINWWILLCPQWLSFDWALGCIDLITNVWDLRLQAVLAMYSLTYVALINHKQNFAPVFGLALMIIPFLPASGIINVGFVIAERVLYVPSIGFCFLVAHSFIYVTKNSIDKWVLFVFKSLLMVLFACLLFRTRERAQEWLTEEGLFKSALKVCPNNAKVHYNIARVATDRLQRDKALDHYHKAIELYPEYESALMNLGNLYREIGDLPAAEKYIKAALKVLPEFPTAWMNLGIVQSARGNYDAAFESYKNALKYRKNYAICHYNIGNLFLDQNMYTDAMHHWQEAVSINPRQPKAWTNILTMLDNRGLYEDALRLSAQALEHLPNETSIMFIRANCFGKLKHYMEAEMLYKLCLEKEPLNVLFHTNLGVLYHRWEKLSSAIESYQRALKLSPEKALTARENLSKLLKRKRKEQMQNTG